MEHIHYIIFLPGLGDQIDHGQIKVLKRWQRPGVKVQYLPMGWSSNESFEAKLGRVLKKIDGLKLKGARVSLVGVSAGASMALNAFKLRKDELKGLVLISGKLHSPWTVSPLYYQKNPALKSSFELAHKNYHSLAKKEKSRMLTMHGFYDHTVPPAASVILGVKNKRIPAIGHIASIAVTLLFYGRTIVNFLEK